MVKDVFSNLKKNKSLMYAFVLSIIVLFCVALNVTFSAFTLNNSTKAATINIAKLKYTINGNETFIMVAPANKVTTQNLLLLSLNNLDTKYELTYEVCDSNDSNCTSPITKPNNLKVEYSSITIDPITGPVEKNGSKSIRIAITNDTENNYYIKLGVNAGFSYNGLRLENDITNKYIEDDLIVTTYVEGIESATFPNDKDDTVYDTTVNCTTDGGTSNATGTVTWDGEKWTLSVNNLDSGKTRCDVLFTAKESGE